METKPEIESIKETTDLTITWIDNRFHIGGITGVSKGNKIIKRSFDEIKDLIKNLQIAVTNFTQEEMINTKIK